MGCTMAFSRASSLSTSPVSWLIQDGAYRWVFPFTRDQVLFFQDHHQWVDGSRVWTVFELGSENRGDVTKLDL